MIGTTTGADDSGTICFGCGDEEGVVEERSDWKSQTSLWPITPQH